MLPSIMRRHPRSHPRTRPGADRRPILLTAAGVSLVAAAVAIAPAGAAAPTVRANPPLMVYQASIAGFPAARSVDYVDATVTTRKRVFVGFGTGPDIPTTRPSYAVLVSGDGAQNFPTSSLDRSGPRAVNLTRMSDGALLDVRPEPRGLVASSLLPAQESRTAVLLRALRSDDGTTWHRLSAECGVPSVATDACLRLRVPLRAGGNVRVNQGLVSYVTPAGQPALMMPYYGAFDGDPAGGRRTEVARSNGGSTWSTLGTIGVPTVVPDGTGDTIGYSEATITRLRDGRLYAVLRTDRRSRDHTAVGTEPLRWSVSSDGSTWSTPRQLTVIPQAGGAAGPWTGVAPTIELLPNGILVLAAGRLDNNVAFADGPGLPTWRGKQVIYSNYPTRGEAVRTRGSSGYMGLAAIAANRSVLIVDNCAAPPWGCPTASTGWIWDGKGSLKKAYLDVVTPAAGKVDLAGKIRSGRITVISNDFTWNSPQHRETRLAGAFDGSTQYWSSAMAAKRAGEAMLTLRLDREHTLNQVGLSLQVGYQGSADVYTSLDPAKGWTRVATLAKRSYALEYLPLAPVRARYVQIRVRPSTMCAPDIGSSCASLNELELYSSAVASFENDPIGSAPRGYPGSSMASVTDRNTDDSGRAVRLADRSTRWTSVLTSPPRAAAVRRTFETKVNALDLRSSVLMSLHGIDGAGRSVSLFRISISTTKGLRTWNRGVMSAHDLSGTTGIFKPGSWHTVRIVASRAQAAVILDGSVRAMMPHPTAGVRSFSTFRVSSVSGPALSEVVLDDLVYE